MTERTIRILVPISERTPRTGHESRLERQSLRHVSRLEPRPARGTSRLSIPSIAMRACTAPCHATRAGRHAGASRRPTSSASSVSVVARAVNAGETSGKATEDGKPVPPALTSEVRDGGVTRCARVMRVKGGRSERSSSISLARSSRARVIRSMVRVIALDSCSIVTLSIRGD